MPVVRGAKAEADQGGAEVKAELAAPIKELIEQEPSFGYRTVAGLLSMNKNGATGLSVDGLAGTQARRGPSPPNPGFAVGGGRA